MLSRAAMAVHSCSMSLCHCNICVRPIIRGASVRSYIGPAIKASRARAQVNRCRSCLLQALPLCMPSSLPSVGFRTCRVGVSRQSSPGWFRPVEALLFFASVLRTLTKERPQKKLTRDRCLSRAGLNEPVRYRLQITAAPPTRREPTNCSAPGVSSSAKTQVRHQQ